MSPNLTLNEAISILKKIEAFRDEMNAKSKSQGTWNSLPMSLDQIRSDIYRSFAWQLTDLLNEV